MLCKVTHCTGHVSANTRTYQLRYLPMHLDNCFVHYGDCIQPDCNYHIWSQALLFQLLYMVTGSPVPTTIYGHRLSCSNYYIWSQALLFQLLYMVTGSPVPTTIYGHRLSCSESNISMHLLVMVVVLFFMETTLVTHTCHLTSLWSSCFSIGFVLLV